MPCYFLQPKVKKLKSYVKDTTDFIKKMEAIDKQSIYLHRQSEHPNSTKKRIAYSQQLRFNKIC